MFILFCLVFFFFFFNDTATTEIYTLSLHDALPFCDGTCAFCRERLHTACVHGGFFDGYGLSAAQAEAVRVPYADGTFYTIPPGEDDALLPSLLTLSDVHGDRPPRRCRRQRRARPPGGGRRRRG